MEKRVGFWRFFGGWMMAGVMGCALARGEDWPQFLGPRRDGTSAETNLLATIPAGGPAIVWSKTIGTGYAAPSVRAGRLVVFHRENDQEVVESLDARTGKTAWRHNYPTSFQDPYGYNNGPRAAPLLTSNRCYTFGAEGHLTCTDLSTGRRVWERATAKDWRIPAAFFGVAAAPLLEDGKLIVLVGGQPEAGVVALDPETGRTLWESVGKSTWDGATTLGWPSERPYAWTGEEMSAGYSSPRAATIQGERHVLCLMRQGLVSLDPARGTVRFKRWFQAPVHESVNAMVPVVDGDRILISSAYYRSGAVLLRVTGGGAPVEEVWRFPRRAMDPADRDAATGRWRPLPLEVHWSTPVVKDGYVYAFSGRNEPDASFRCVELATGKVAWERDERWTHGRAGEQPGVYGRGSLILAEGKLLVLGEGGLLGLFEAAPTAPRERGRWQVPQLSFPCWAAPVLAEGLLYLRDERHVVCVDMRRETGRGSRPVTN